MHEYVYVSVYVCSGLDEQTVSGLCEVPASLGVEGARKRQGEMGRGGGRGADMTARKRWKPKSAE